MQNTTTESDKSSLFRGDIQGLRAIAVVAVVLYHAGVPFVPGGYIGVDVFFVISGFLITSHLIAGFRRDGHMRFAAFYARRARRILPASFLVLVVSILAALLVYPPLLMRSVWEGAVATALYVPNYLFAYRGTDYLAETTPSLFQHYWSLGVEEQFYLIWPLLLALGFAFVRRPGALFGMVVALVAVSFAACVVLTSQSQPWAFFALPTRAWELGIGGLVAFAVSYRPRPLTGPFAATLGWLGVAGIVGSAAWFGSTTPFPSYWAAVPVLATALVILAGASVPRYGPATTLSMRGMLFIGLISYSLYLVHWPLLMLPQAALGFQNPLPSVARLFLGALSVPIAWLMYRFVEEPWRRAEWLTAARARRTLLLAGGASATTVVLATAVFAYSSQQPLDSGRVAPDTVIVAPPLITDYVPSNLQPPLRGASGDVPRVYDDGCHLDFHDVQPKDCLYGDPGAPRIVLFGDSHAAQWFPALAKYAEERGFAVEPHTKSACPSVSVDIARAGILYRECRAWRQAVLARLRGEPPALVIISNSGNAQLFDKSTDPVTTWSDSLAETLDAIQAPVLVVADTPRFQANPVDCLSTELQYALNCARPRAEALNSAMRTAESSTTRLLGVPYVDLTEYICTEDTCAPIVGRTLTFRDEHHLTTRFSTELAEVLGSAVDDVLASSR